jgi:excisionase family DNA binding protein
MKRSRKSERAAATPDPELLTVREAAALLNRTAGTVRNLLRQKRLEGKLVLAEVRITRRSVEQLLRPRPYRPQKPAPPRRKPVYGRPEAPEAAEQLEAAS